MSKKWSHPTWAFFHTFGEKVDESFYNRNRDICLRIIKTICGLLPCPVCRVHAMRYMKRINVQHLPTKEHFKTMLFDSVAPLVKKISLGFAPINRESCSLDFSIAFSARLPKECVLLAGFP